MHQRLAKLSQRTRIKTFSPKNLSIKDFYEKRNKILLIRRYGGLGDILMCRMLFEDFKKIMPEARLTFACPSKYFEAVEGHPYLDEVVDVEKVKLDDYLTSYDVSTACGKHETKIAPLADEHRSDIWAEHCGLSLTSHDMHLSLPEGFTENCRKQLESYRTEETGPIVLFSPISAIYSKNLTIDQCNEVITGLKEMGCLVVGIHTKPINGFQAAVLPKCTIRQYLGFINAADYIITVDTAAFHAAGGFDKPTVAIFSWADGKVYGKWYSRFILVQRHRDNGDWDCGPCYLWTNCPKCKGPIKPCITDLTSQEILEAAKEMLRKW